MDQANIEEFSRSLIQLNQNYQNIIGSNEGSDVLLTFCKKERRNFQTVYKYFKASHEGEASTAFENILKNSLEEASQLEISTNIANENPHTLIIIDLNNISAWTEYEEGLNISNQNLEDLNALKRQLNSYIIAYNDEERTIGQIRRLTGKKVLLDNNTQKAYYNNNTFDSVRAESDSVEIDDEFDVFFIIEGEEKIALVKDLDMFVEIFDLDEETKNNAIQVISSSNIFSLCDESNEILEIVEKDRNIQYMLKNSLTCEGISNVTIQNLNEIKAKLGDLVTFNLNNDKILLDSSNKKKSVIHLIKAAGYRYNQSLYDELIMEGIPQKKLN